MKIIIKTKKMEKANISLITKLKIDECKSVLNSTLTSPLSRNDFEFEEKGNNFQINKKVLYKNSFIPYFFGEYSESNGSTIIKGYFDVNSKVRYFIYFWCVFVLFIYLVSTFAITEKEGKIPYFVPIFMIFFGLTLYNFGVWLSRGHKNIILSFLQNTLKAKMDNFPEYKL